MLLSPGWTAILVPVTLLVAGALATSDAVAQDRCSGTLCDLYYGGPAPEPATPPSGATPAAPTPLMVPSGGILGFFGGGAATPPAAPGAAAPPASRPMIGVGGGGVAAMARGAPAERCTGTLCDFVYGGSSPDQPMTRSDGVPEGLSEQASQAAAAAAPDVASEPALGSPVEAGVRYAPVPIKEAPPRCAATAQDPWKCYR